VAAAPLHLQRTLLHAGHHARPAGWRLSSGQTVGQARGPRRSRPCLRVLALLAARQTRGLL